MDDGTRVYSDPADRARFFALSQDALERSGVDYVRLSGSWAQRRETALEAIARRFPHLMTQA